MNPLLTLREFGQSVWLDYIRRNLLTGGELKRLVEEDGVRGVTSNPAIFEKAISGSSDYDDALRELASHGADPNTAYERLAVADIQDAADVLRPVYEQSKKRDGFVSLEVSPLLAHDTNGTIADARRLWNLVGRPNVMIKVPGTSEGLPAIEQLISEGINVNITLLFYQPVYERVTEAFISGLEKRAARGGDLTHVSSVASFFVSRIDTLVDSIVADHLKSPAADQRLLNSLTGKVAIANAKLTYRKYAEIFGTGRWQKLAQKGAQVQRVLWASTSTKNPAYRDVIYVEELVGPETVNTLPPQTLDAFREHGQVRASLTENVESAEEIMRNLERAGISMKEVTDRLLVDAVRLFREPFEKLLSALDQKLTVMRPATR